MTNLPVQLIFQAIGLWHLKIKEASQIAYQGQEGEPFPPEKDLVKAQLVVELMDRYHYAPELIHLNVLLTLKGPKFGYMEADVLITTPNHNPYIVFAIEAPQEYEAKKKENLSALFEVASAFPVDALPSYLGYYTRWYRQGNLVRHLMLIDFRKYPTFSKWHKASQPFQTSLPESI